MKETKKELFLKVLDENMRSCNGGTQQWQIGKTVTVKGKIEMCQRGLHLTFQPSNWNGQHIFIAETSKVYAFQAEGMKVVCRTAKLLEELSPKLLKAYKEGEAPLLKAYKEGKASLWKAYKEGEAPLLKAYKEGEAPLLKAYEEGEASLLKAYKEKCQEILTKMLKGEN